MDNKNNLQSRKKFLGIGISAATLFTTFKFFTPKKKKDKGTVRMLSENGELVEVNIASIPSKKKKITNGELQNWIKK